MVEIVRIIKSRLAAAFACLAVSASALAQSGAPAAQPATPPANGRRRLRPCPTPPAGRWRSISTPIRCFACAAQQTGFEPFRAVDRHRGRAPSGHARSRRERGRGARRARGGAHGAAADRRPQRHLLSRALARILATIRSTSSSGRGPRQRTDAILSASARRSSISARPRGASSPPARGCARAGADLEVAADRIALNAIAAWYDVFAYRALVALTEAFVASQRELRAAVADPHPRGRLGRGRPAPGSIPTSPRPRPASPASAACSPAPRRASPS